MRTEVFQAGLVATAFERQADSFVEPEGRCHPLPMIERVQLPILNLDLLSLLGSLFAVEKAFFLEG